MKKFTLVIILTGAAVVSLSTLGFLFATKWYRQSKSSASKLIKKYDEGSDLSFTQGPNNDWNVIFILTDDQSFDSVQYMPRFEKLAQAKGITFSNSIVTNPVCCPVRASILAGGFSAHETGVKTNDFPNGSLKLLDESKTMPVILQQAGIRTGFVGKYLHSYPPGYIPPGWDSFVANEKGSMIHDYHQLFKITRGSSSQIAARGQVEHKKEPLEKYVTTFQTDEAIAFLKENHKNSFFLFLSYYAPHNPFIPETKEDLDNANELSFHPDENSDLKLKPAWTSVSKAVLDSMPEWTGGEPAFRGQAALLASLDRNLTRLFASLDELKLRDNTLIIFSSDNGKVIGSDYLYPDKGMPYEGAIRVPLVLIPPDSSSSSVRKELVAMNLDVPATIYDVFGVSAPTEGVSLLNLPFPGNRQILIEDFGYLEYRRQIHGELLPPMKWAGYRTPKFKYVEWASGERELYSLENDPKEKQNLVFHSDFSNLVEEFHFSLAIDRGLTIVSDELLSFSVTESIHQQLQALGGEKPYHWSVLKGRLPSGIVIDSDSGVLFGSPKNPGNYEAEILVESSNFTAYSGLPERFIQRVVFQIKE